MDRKTLPAPGHSYHPWDDMSERNTLPHEQTPTQPGATHQSPGPTADPEGQRLKERERVKGREC